MPDQNRCLSTVRYAIPPVDMKAYLVFAAAVMVGGCSPARNAVRVDFFLPEAFHGPVFVYASEKAASVPDLNGVLRVEIPPNGKVAFASLPWRTRKYQPRAFAGANEVGVGFPFGRCSDCRFWILNQRSVTEFQAFVGTFEEAKEFMATSEGGISVGVEER